MVWAAIKRIIHVSDESAKILTMLLYMYPFPSLFVNLSNLTFCLNLALFSNPIDECSAFFECLYCYDLLNSQIFMQISLLVQNHIVYI